MFMKSFEPVYKELEYLLIQKLPECIDKINKEHNDGIILKPFENKSLEENCIKLPSFTFNIDETEYSEKDRIIENTVFTVSLEIKLETNKQNKTIIIWRYFEAIEITINSNEYWQECKINKTFKDRLFLRILV